MSWRWLEICQHHRTWLKRTNMCTYTNVEDSRNSTYSSLFGKIMITEKPWNFGLPSFETKAYWWTAASSLTLESPLQAQWNPRQYRISFYIISYYIIVYYIIISILYHTILHYIYICLYVYIPINWQTLHIFGTSHPFVCRTVAQAFPKSCNGGLLWASEQHGTDLFLFAVYLRIAMISSNCPSWSPLQSECSWLEALFFAGDPLVI